MGERTYTYTSFPYTFFILIHIFNSTLIHNFFPHKHTQSSSNVIFFVSYIRVHTQTNTLLVFFNFVRRDDDACMLTQRRYDSLCTFVCVRLILLLLNMKFLNSLSWLLVTDGCIFVLHRVFLVFRTIFKWKKDKKYKCYWQVKCLWGNTKNYK